MRGLLTAFVLLIAPSTSVFASITVIGDVADQTIRKDGGRVNTPTGRVGASKSGAPAAQGSRVAVYVFQLPAPRSGELPIVTQADFRFTVVNDLMAGDYGIDLYGLPARPGPPLVLSTDNYSGPTMSSSGPSGDTLIRTAILAKSGTTPRLGVIATSDSAPPPGIGDPLVSYLNMQYGTSGIRAGEYVYLRLSPQINPPVEDSGVDVAFADNVTGKPELTITFVPEPSALAHVAGIISLLLCWRPVKARTSFRGTV